MKGLEHLKSKRYWALILLGPPLRVVSAYALFAALHLGLGLPWPTLEDAGLVASMLEMFGFLMVLLVADRIAIRMVYGPRSPVQGKLRRLGDEGMLGVFVGSLAVAPGYAAVLGVERYFGLQPAIDFDNGFIVLLVVILATFHNAEQVWRAERRRLCQPDSAEGTSG